MNHYEEYVKSTGKDPEAFILRKLAADEWAYAPEGSSLKEDAALVMMKPFLWWAGRFDDKEVIELLRKANVPTRI